jgi:transposase-like protein
MSEATETLVQAVAAPDPQCPACRSWNVDEDEEHDPPGAYYRCRQCGETWVEHSDDDNEYILAELLESLEGRAVVQPIER